VRARFAATVAGVAEHSARQVDSVRAELPAFLPLRGDERALDAGTGAGTLAFALAPLVSQVVAVDLVPELLDAARLAAPANVELVQGDAAALSFPDASFDLAASRRTLHHTARPEAVVAELARVTRPGGLVFVDDQLAPADPEAARALDAFERARDPSHGRTFTDEELRGVFGAQGLVLERTRYRRHRRELGFYLDLAGCAGAARERARALSPGGPEAYEAETGWYLLRRP
jgi:SAM-dependent methyltransferase